MNYYTTWACSAAGDAPEESVCSWPLVPPPAFGALLTGNSMGNSDPFLVVQTALRPSRFSPHVHVECNAARASSTSVLPVRDQHRPVRAEVQCQRVDLAGIVCSKGQEPERRFAAVTTVISMIAE